MFKRIIKDTLFGNSLWLFLTSIVVAGLGFLFWTINAWIFPSDQIGIATTLISAVELLVSLSLLGFDVALIKFLPITRLRVKLFGICITLSSIISIALGFIFIIFIDVFSPSLMILKQPVFYISFIIMIIFRNAYKITDSVFIAQNKSRYIFFRYLISNSLKIIFIALFITMGVFAMFGSWLFGMVIAFIISMVWIKYPIIPVFDKKILKNIWKFSGVNYISGFLILAPQTILPLMILNILGPSESAYFYIVWMISTVIFMIPNSVSKTLLAQNEKELSKNIIKSIKFSLLLLLPTVTIVALFSKHILLLFGTEYSINASSLLMITAISAFPLALNLIYVSIMNVKQKIGQVFLIHLILNMLTLILSYFTMQLGLVMIGYAWLVSQILVAIPISIKIWRLIADA